MDQVRPGDDDERLLAQFRRLAAAFDPVPSWVVATAHGSFAWRRVDAELAELTYDSAAHDDRLMGVRGRSEARLLTFAASVALELEVTQLQSGRRRLVGRVVPAQPTSIEVRHSNGTAVADADHDGMFAADEIPAGPISVRYRLREHADRPIVSEWTLI